MNGTVSKRWRKIIFWFGIVPIAVLAIYALSFGPVVYVVKRASLDENSAIFKVIEGLYFPLFELPGGVVTDKLDDYTSWWIEMAERHTNYRDYK